MSSVTSRRPARRSRAEWYALASGLQEQGVMNGSEIARRLGLSSSFVNGLLNDPDGLKERKRKSGYQGVCVDCGGATHGGDGNGPKASVRCDACNRAFQTANRIWNRERIIEAIRLFARENGRPPKATEWLTRPHDPRFPYAAQVYKSTMHPNNPFDFWADAIEAAGFPRPIAHQYDRVGEVGLFKQQRETLRLAQKGPLTSRLLVERGIYENVDNAGYGLRRLAKRGLLVRERRDGRGWPYIYRLSVDGDAA